MDFTIPLHPKGAQVRQAGPLSFVRVYSAGHTVAMQQPQIAQAVFNRAIAGLDIATGSVIAGKKYATVHQYPSWEWEEESPAAASEGPCYILNLGLCSPVQRQTYLNGSGVVRDYFLVADVKGECIQNPIQPCMKAKVQTFLGDATKDAGESDAGKLDTGKSHTGKDGILNLLVVATGIGYMICMTVLGTYWWTSKDGPLYSAL